MPEEKIYILGFTEEVSVNSNVNETCQDEDVIHIQNKSKIESK